MQPGIKRRLFILVAVFLLLLTLLNWTKYKDQPVLEPVESFVQGIFSPVQNFLTSGISEVKDWFKFIASYKEIISENKRLTAEVSEQGSLMTDYLELKLENQRLREMLDFQSSSEGELLPASVIARESSQWFSIVTINRGQKDGLEAEMPVITSAGLVGRILDANIYTAQVMLLTDPLSKVSVIIQRTRDHGILGIVEGSRDEAGGMRATNILPDSDVLPDDAVITSGMGGIYPKGLIVGKVISIEEDQFGLLKAAWVEPAVDFSRLEEVMVIIQKSEGEEEGSGEDDK